MARRPRSLAAMESQGSIDPRVRYVPVPDARRLVVIPASGWHSLNEIAGAIVWLKPDPARSDQELVDAAVRLRADGAAHVVLLPRDAEDAPLPVEAGSPAPTSDVSEVRPVVAELLTELPDAVRPGASAYVELLLSEAGL